MAYFQTLEQYLVQASTAAHRVDQAIVQQASVCFLLALCRVLQVQGTLREQDGQELAVSW